MPEFAARCSGNMAEEGPGDVENPRDDEVAVRQADVGHWDVATVLLMAGHFKTLFIHRLGLFPNRATSFVHVVCCTGKTLSKPHHLLRELTLFAQLLSEPCSRCWNSDVGFFGHTTECFAKKAT